MSISFTPATTLAAAIQNGDRSPVEVVDDSLDRIRSRDGEINAFITVIEDEAREAAREAEQALANGDDVGPLHGLPVALKDLTAFKAGVRHTFGCQAFSDNVADHTTPFVQRLEDAGAIVVGKTNTPEFGHRSTTDNLLIGPTSTPFDVDCNAGGSSGGSAAAVADGMVPLGQGGDAGGSVRIPAALCGVYGLKPSFGRIPQSTRPNAFRNHTPFIDKGPITRTVADAALMLDVMAGPHPRDPFSLPDDDCNYADATERSIEGMKVAYSPDLGGFPVSNTVEEIITDAIETFERVGAIVDLVDVEYGQPYEEIRNGARKPINHALRGSVHQNLRDVHGIDFLGPDRESVPERYRDGIRHGERMTTRDFERMNRTRTAVFDAFQDVFDAYDIVVSPTLAVASVPNGATGPDSIDGSEKDETSDWVLTWPFNLTGHPVASIPAGMTDDGYPVGMQIAGRRFAENTVLAASAAFERRQPWQDTYPGIEGRG